MALSGSFIELDPQTHPRSFLHRCLQEVPEEFRTVVVLCDIEEVGYNNVAELLGIPRRTVKSRHARGRARLRDPYERLAAPRVVAAREGST
ncbi:sigma factor-like helix-turn-helix DNA-binding protein [Sorangium sp. So ce124]|uniref:sigma factor-like helix-turn-helix DNA-binding protein n=1 Tax=Sorangium sp. So ce124 TaxID=3133280 RepID=UPI003F5DB497